MRSCREPETAVHNFWSPDGIRGSLQRAAAAASAAVVLPPEAARQQPPPPLLLLRAGKVVVSN